MATTLHRLAQWALSLRAVDIPDDVLAHARLQQLSVAGAIRSMHGTDLAAQLVAAGPKRGAAPLTIDGRSTTAAHALRVHAALAAALDFDDVLAFGQPGPGAVPATWLPAKGDMESAWVATVAANEVAGRIGAACVFGQNLGQGATFVPAVASAVALAHRQKLDANVLANALALFLGNPPVPSLHTLLGTGWSRALAVASAVCQATEALEYAKAGAQGPIDTLDRRDGALSRLCRLPLQSAFNGLGSAWLTRTLCFKRLPGSVFAQVPIEALDEVFRRHVKAADKRLRCDQVHSLEIRTSAPGFLMEQASATHPGLTPPALAHSIAKSAGALLSNYQLTGPDLRSETLAADSERILHVAGRVSVVHDWEQTVRLVDDLLVAFEPLFTGVSRAELKVAGQHARHIFGAVPFPSWGDLLVKAIRARPDRLLHRIGQGSGNLADTRLDHWTWPFGAQINLFSTRGGRWPERRVSPDSVSATDEKRAEWLLDRFAAGEEVARERAEAFYALGGDSDVSEALSLCA